MVKYRNALLITGLAAFTALSVPPTRAFAQITNTPTISSSTHTANVSSTASDITLSWNAATSSLSGDITYNYVLDQTATHTDGSFQTNLDATNTSTLKSGTLTNSVSTNFSSITDGDFYFHLRAYDSDGPAKGTAIIKFGPIKIDTTPTLATTPISPATGDHSKAISVTITGTKFVNGATVSLVNGDRSGTSLSDVALTGVTWSSATSITATVPKDTVPGTYDLKVVNGDPGKQTVAATDKYQSTNQLPVAAAGADQSLTLSGGSVSLSLSGASSSDPDGDTISTYTWTPTTDPSSALSATYSGSSQTIVLSTAGTYVFSLVVNDGFQNSSADTVTITVASTSNNPPTANAGIDQTTTPGTQITLNGSQSADTDSNPLTYTWTLTDKPSTSSKSSTDIAQTANTATTATFTPDVAGSYTISLVVNDGTVNSTADTMVITANTKPTAAISYTPTTVTTGTQVTLDGTGSTDTDSDTLTYSWSLTTAGGASDKLSSTTAAKPTFTPTCAGTYTASLTVNDGKQDSAAAATQAITVTGTTCATLDVDGDGDGDANDGLMVQRRLTGAGTVDTGIVLPTGITGGEGTSGARTNAQIIAIIDNSGTAYDVDGDGDADANDGLMLQRRLNGAGTVDTGVVLPTGITGGLGTSGARTNTQILAIIDALDPG